MRCPRRTFFRCRCCLLGLMLPWKLRACCLISHVIGGLPAAWGASILRWSKLSTVPDNRQPRSPSVRGTVHLSAGYEFWAIAQKRVQLGACFLSGMTTRPLRRVRRGCTQRPPATSHASRSARPPICCSSKTRPKSRRCNRVSRGEHDDDYREQDLKSERGQGR